MLPASSICDKALFLKKKIYLSSYTLSFLSQLILCFVFKAAIAILAITLLCVDMQEVQRNEEPRRPSSSDMSGPPTRSSKRGPGQLQL